MARRLIPGILAALALAGCSDQVTDYPALLPTDQLLADPRLPAHAAEVRGDPAAASGTLAGRATALSSRTAGPSGTADLARRAEALRIRGKALSRRSLDDCPEGPGACDPDRPATDPTADTTERP